MPAHSLSIDMLCRICSLTAENLAECNLAGKAIRAYRHELGFRLVMVKSATICEERYDWP